MILAANPSFASINFQVKGFNDEDDDDDDDDDDDPKKCKYLPSRLPIHLARC